MIRFCIVSCLFVFSLLATEHTGLLRANKWLAEESTKSILKAYHEYKNIRINAIMDDDTDLRLKSISGIVKAGQLLHINIEKYRNELLRLTGKEPPAKLPEKESPSLQISQNYLKSARWQSGAIILSFSDLLREEQVKHFILDKKFNKHYRYIFDIKSKASEHIRLDKMHLDDLRLNCADTDKVRLVLESKDELPLHYIRRGKELLISFGEETKSVPLTEEGIKKEQTRQKVIVIDAGHGGRDGGAVGHKNYREKVIVFQIAKRFKKALEKLGFKVFMTRNRDNYIKLRRRTAYANEKKADLFISIHANSVVKKGKYTRHHGIETYYLSTTSSKRAKSVAATENSEDVESMNFFAKESFLGLLNSQKIVASNKLAIDLQRGMLGILRKSYTYIRDGGVKKGPFWVLVGAQMPAVLVEVGFVTSPKEARYLVNRQYQSRLALGLALGVKNYFKNNR